MTRNGVWPSIKVVPPSPVLYVSEAPAVSLPAATHGHAVGTCWACGLSPASHGAPIVLGRAGWPRLS